MSAHRQPATAEPGQRHPVGHGVEDNLERHTDLEILRCGIHHTAEQAHPLVHLDDDDGVRGVLLEVWMEGALDDRPGEQGTPATRTRPLPCLLYTSDAADDLLCVDLGGRRIIKK